MPRIFEEIERVGLTTCERRGSEHVSRQHRRAARPDFYDSITAGVADTPIRGLRLSGNYSTQRQNQFRHRAGHLRRSAAGREGREQGYWPEVRSLGSPYFGQRELLYFRGAELFGRPGGLQDDIDPDGINGRNGGSFYIYDKTSDGFNLTLTSRPMKGWEIRINFATANGSERTDVILAPILQRQVQHDDGGRPAGCGRGSAASAAVTPLMVPFDPRDPASAQTPLSLAMMRDPNSPYFATLDPDSGQILNAQTLGLRTAGVGTNETGLPISEHQLGFVSPSGGTILVKKAGEQTVNYAERSYSLVESLPDQRGPLPWAGPRR